MADSKNVRLNEFLQLLKNEGRNVFPPSRVNLTKFLSYYSAMDRTNLQPLLVLHCPPGHEVDPNALQALKQFVGDEFGAGVLLNPFMGYDCPPPLLLGQWPLAPEFVLIELQPFLDQAFFTLDWLEEAL